MLGDSYHPGLDVYGSLSKKFRNVH
jgi:hypothetical protein